MAASGGTALNVVLVGAMVLGYVVVFALWWFVFRTPRSKRSDKRPDEPNDMPRA